MRLGQVTQLSEDLPRLRFLYPLPEPLVGELEELEDADRVLEVDPLAVGMEITCR